MRATVAVGAIVFDDAGRVLLVQRGRPPGVGRWTVPGGKVEPGERLADAIIREVREETGLDVEPGPLVEIVERIIPRRPGPDDATPGWHYVIHDHLATARGGTLQAGDDVTDARWVSDADLADLPLSDGLLAVLARARILAARIGG